MIIDHKQIETTSWNGVRDDVTVRHGAGSGDRHRHVSLLLPQNSSLQSASLLRLCRGILWFTSGTSCSASPSCSGPSPFTGVRESGRPLPVSSSVSYRYCSSLVHSFIQRETERVQTCWFSLINCRGH